MRKRKTANNLLTKRIGNGCTTRKRTYSKGNVFEVFHYEWDDFQVETVQRKKIEIEQLVLSTDWEEKAQELLARKDEWCELDFFEQSDWKANFYGVTPERFKNIIWEI